MLSTMVVMMCQDQDADGIETSDWNRYAAEEYELLVAEEGASEPQDDL